MFEEIKNKDSKYSITLGELREFIYNNLRNFPDDVEINIVAKDASNQIAVDVKHIIANEDSITFYDF